MCSSIELWRWFKTYELPLFRSARKVLEGKADPLWQELEERMSLLHSSLSYLVSDIMADGRRDFIITANGDSKAVPAVVNLYRDAPPLSLWRVLKYRPRRFGEWDLTYEGKPIDPDGIEFVLFTRNQRPSLMLFVRNYDPSHDGASWYQEALPVLVDQLLGKVDSMWLEEILIFPWEDPTRAKRFPARLLATAFDQMKEKLPAQRV